MKGGGKGRAEAGEGELEGARGRKRKRTFSQNYPKLDHFNLSVYNISPMGALTCDPWDHRNSQQTTCAADQGQGTPSG